MVFKAQCRASQKRYNQETITTAEHSPKSLWPVDIKNTFYFANDDMIIVVINFLIKEILIFFVHSHFFHLLGCM